ncbi:MAG: glucose/sorbosone dehydrogenase [Chitinophagaceae bacterium]|nr:MAG: glucose/sorbosone dehydrogenase [Chitinophagaceae bacterium]
MSNKLCAVLLLLALGCNEKKEEKKIEEKIVQKDSLFSPEVLEEKRVDSANANAAPAFNTVSAQIPLEPHLIRLEKGDSFYLNIPRGFKINVAAEIGQRLRFLALSPDGRLFATDMLNTSDNKKGRVIIFENWNNDTKRFENIHTYLGNLHNPNQVAFYKDHIYIAETGKLRRFSYRSGDKEPRDSGQTIASFPDYGLSYKYGGWHLTRSIDFHNDKLYVSVGSSCNACVETEEVRASVIEMNPDGSEAMVYARGLRNTVGIKWVGNQLWGSGMGRDLIGADKPEDLFQQIEKDGYYGWPFYYQYRQQVFADDQFKDSARAPWVKAPPVAMVGFKAHSAPLGFEFFKNFDHPVLKNSVLVCLHGSTTVSRQRGNSVVRIESNDRYTDVVSGFLTGKTEADRHGRPCDILMVNESSFFFTDDKNGVLYYVSAEQ